jgi:opacity protein-like surface antigen
METAMKRILTVLAAAVLSTTAFADDAIEKPYLGLSFQQGSFSQTGSSTIHVPALRVHMGSELAPMFAVEAHVGTGVSSTKVNLNSSADYNVSVRRYAGAFLRPQLTLGGDEIKLFGLIGYSIVEFRAKAVDSGVDTINGHSSGTSFGGGLELGIYKNFSLRADYVHYVQSYSAASVGIGMTF